MPSRIDSRKKRDLDISVSSRWLVTRHFSAPPIRRVYDSSSTSASASSFRALNDSKEEDVLTLLWEHHQKQGFIQTDHSDLLTRRNMSRNKKIPGDVLPSMKDNQGYIDDLGKKQRFQLEELLERQKRILANKKFISRLPDKGEKIISFHDKILKELERRNKVEEAANLLSRLNIASEGKAAMSKLEWTGKYNDEDMTKIVELDSDDEEDPLKILAQPTGTGVHKKKIIRLTPEESLIKPEDIAEIETFETDPLDLEHVKYIVDKVEKAQETNKKEPFKPYKTTKSNVHDPMKEKQRKLHKNWEVTAATPPLIVHGAAKVLSLNESLRLQKQQTEKLQEIQAKHAVERLASQVGLYDICPTPHNVDNYRSHTNGLLSSSSSSDNGEDHEMHDEEDNDRSGTVVFTADSIES